MFKIKDITEFCVFFFVYMHVISLFYLVEVWGYFNVVVFDYLSVQDLIFSTGNYVFYYAFFFINWIVAINAISYKELSSDFNFIMLLILFPFSILSFAVYYFFNTSIIAFAFYLLTVVLFLHFLSVVAEYFSDSESSFLGIKIYYPYIFLVTSGIFLFSSQADFDRRVMGKREVNDVHTIVSVKDEQSCEYRMIGVLGRFYFLIPRLANKSIYIEELNTLIAVPDYNIEKIIHHRVSNGFKLKNPC